MLFLGVLAQVSNVLPPDWRARPLSPGAWNWRADAASSEALFADAGGTQLTIRCERATRQVIISRGPVPAAGGTRVATTSAERVLPAGGVLAATDPLLDAIAFSRGRIFVGVEGRAPLIVRSAAEPARAVEDCRS